MSYLADDGPPNFPPQVKDVAITNSSAWNIGIDPSTLVFHRQSTKNGLKNPIWGYQAPPTYITGKGCEIDWPLYNGVPAPLPALPAGVTTRKCTGKVVDVRLAPLGSLKIHMSELPVVDVKDPPS